MKHLFVIAEIIMLLYAPSSVNAREQAEQKGGWSTIQPVHYEVNFLTGPIFDLRFSIPGEDGYQLYTIECHDYTYDSLEFSSPFDGDFGCILSLGKRGKNLLVMDSASVWERRRGDFQAWSMEGACSDYPDYGTVRTFRLRGMQITLALKDLVMKRKRIPTISWSDVKWKLDIKKFRFVADVVPDPTAISAEPEPSAYLPPPNVGSDMFYPTLDCSKVLLRSGADPQQEKKELK